MTHRVLVADPLADEGLRVLRSDDRIELIERSDRGADALAEALRDADAVIVRGMTRITRELIGHSPRLRVIGRAGVGVDSIDVGAATERGVAVLNAPSGNTVSAAELTMGLLLALVRHIPAADRSMRAGEWERKRFRGIELYGRTLGLIGAGRIGGAVARRARAFGMDVVAYDPYVEAERARALGIELADLDTVLRRADVLSLHVPLTGATEGMVGEEELARMKEGAYLINAARGGVVDESALRRALESGRLAGAALDVYEDEPPPADHPLRTLDDVVLMPHLGGKTEEARRKIAIEICEAVRSALVEGDVSRAVNAAAL